MYFTMPPLCLCHIVQEDMRSRFIIDSSGIVKHIDFGIVLHLLNTLCGVSYYFKFSL